eukprot:1647804-Pleurochrysis_carterae.AAC.1
MERARPAARNTDTSAKVRRHFIRTSSTLNERTRTDLASHLASHHFSCHIAHASSNTHTRVVCCSHP